MARGLLATDAVDLGVIAPARVRRFASCDLHQVRQWLVPAKETLGDDGLPAATQVRAIVEAVSEFGPDLVHVWGTETYWGLLTARELLKYPTLLDIQGLKGPIAKVFYGGLTLIEQLRCTGPKELLKRRTMHSDRRDFARWGTFEREIIRGHRFIGVQSAWVTAHVMAANPEARTYSVDLALRPPFYAQHPWRPAESPIVFCSAAYSAPFKGLHVAIRALELLRRRIPKARLRIAGAHQRSGVRQDGYVRWLNRMVSRLGLEDAVDWLGPLDAEQIAAELRHAGAAVIPTFIENCCAAAQEAMAIGTPVVASYAGGIPSLGSDGDCCLFFPPGDEVMCAHLLALVLTDSELALRLSRISRQVAVARNNPERIVQRQLEIYRHVLSG